MPKAFTRPSTLRFPQIYGTFRARASDSEDVIDYLIQELPEECFDEALDLLVHEHLSEETLHACRGLEGNSEAENEAREDWRTKLEARLSIACFRSDGGSLVGVNVLGVVSRSDEDDGKSPQSEEFADVIRAFSHIAMQHDVFEAYGVDNFLTDYGLVINREYRQRGIATEMLKARVDVARALGLRVTSSIFTAIASQKAAEKAGFKEILSISYEELAEIFPNFDFSQATAECVKILDNEVL